MYNNLKVVRAKLRAKVRKVLKEVKAKQPALAKPGEARGLRRRRLCLQNLKRLQVK